MSVTTRPIQATDKERWLVLWQGYLDFYKTTVAAEQTERTWTRIMDPEFNMKCAVVELDVTSQSSVDALVAKLGNAPVSVLVHSAGGAFDADSVMDSDPELWQKTFDINVVGAVRMVKAITPLFREHRKWLLDTFIDLCCRLGISLVTNLGKFLSLHNSRRDFCNANWFSIEFKAKCVYK